MLVWTNSKQGTFTSEEKETIVIANNGETTVTTSDTPFITKVIKLYEDSLDIQVLYYGISSTTGEKYPTEVRVVIPKGRFVTLRSLKSKSTENNS